MNEDLKWLAENVHEWPFGYDHTIVKSKYDDEFFFDGPNADRGYTRAQWQAARDELSGGVRIDPDSRTITEWPNHSVEPTEKEWRGPEDGLPPVGTECICEYYSFGLKCHAAKIVAYSGNRVWVDSQSGDSLILIVNETDFKPLPTEEDKAVESIRDEVYAEGGAITENAARILYRAGYRKQESE